MNDINRLVRRFTTGLYVSMVILTLISKPFYRRFNLHQIILAFIRKKYFGECLFQRSIAHYRDFPRLFSCLSSIFFIGSHPSLEASLCWNRFFSQISQMEGIKILNTIYFLSIEVNLLMKLCRIKSYSIL